MSETEIGYVYLGERYVGELRRVGGEYFFEYDQSYRSDDEAPPLSLSLPKRSTIHQDKYLFPFFEGLLSEGWLKKIQEQTQKIDAKDSFRRLLENGEELIGAVSVLRTRR